MTKLERQNRFWKLAGLLMLLGIVFSLTANVTAQQVHWEPVIPPPTAILAVALFAIGGFRLVLWGIFLRTVVGLHATWIVNSAAHIWGSRRFETRDTSTNNWWVAMVSFGDGWHNNHHSYPVSARHGLKWDEFDFNWYTIWMFKQFGLASRIHRAELPAGTCSGKSLAPNRVIDESLQRT